MLGEQLARTLQAFLCQRDGLGFSHWIADHAFLVQPIHRIPVMSLPNAVAVMQRQKEQREHHLIDFIFVVFHACIVQFRSAVARACHINRLTNHWSQPLAAVKSTFDFMKQFRMFATLAAASGGSAPSR
jgi:hypothetical protein